jgi:hypothetical protein
MTAYPEFSRLNELIYFTIKMPLLAITGKKGSGKTTVAGFLKTRLHEEVSFASPLKELCRTVFGLTSEQLEDPVLKETVDFRYGVSPRKILQEVGTGLFRETLPKLIPNTEHIWVRCLGRKIDELTEMGVTNIVVSDVRFDDEADFLRKRKFTIIHTIRPGQVVDSHSSELGITRDPSDLVIENSSGLSDLYARC